MINIQQPIQEHQQVIASLEALIPTINTLAQRMIITLNLGGKIFWMGNGGSASDAQHLAAEMVGRFKRERKAFASIALNTDTSILTCLSNDYDYSVVFARQIEALCGPNDMVVGLTTSGNSLNILKGIQQAKQLGAYTVGLTGQTGGKLKPEVDLCLCVPSQTIARIQEAHILIGHILCEYVEEAVMIQGVAGSHATV